MQITFFTAALLASHSSALDLSSLTQVAKDQVILHGQTEHSCLDDLYSEHAVPDFYTIVGQTSLWEDPHFKPEDDSLFWADMNESPAGLVALSKMPLFSWTRASEAFPDATLFGDGITHQDIIQGQASGDCWFLSSCAALAQSGDRIEKIFLNQDNEQNKAGIYGLNLFRLGVPATIVIDDFLPLGRKSENSELTTAFAKIGKDSSLWGPLIEKALAKLHGNYSHLEGGEPRDALRSLTGAPSKHQMHVHEQVVGQNLWHDLVEWSGKNAVITTGTPPPTNPGVVKLKNGLYYGHAYSVFGAYTLSNGTKLIKVRNPHGKDSYTGAWSDSDTKSWDSIPAAEKNELYVNDEDDGVFFMEYGTYYVSFNNTSITFDVSDWHFAYYLRTNDSGIGSYPGEMCARREENVEGCLKYFFPIKSQIDQTIYVTANIWKQDRRAAVCKPTRKVDNIIDIYDEAAPLHTLKPEAFMAKYKSGRMAPFNDGSMQLSPISIKAGEVVTIMTEFDFREDVRNLIPNDWSVTVWGDKGPLEIDEEDLLMPSHDWEFIERR